MLFGWTIRNRYIYFEYEIKNSILSNFTNLRLNVKREDGSNIIYSQKMSNDGYVNFTIYEKAFSIYILIKQIQQLLDNIQLEKGTSATNCEPYKKIWYVYKEIWKYIFDEKIVI